MSIYNSEFLLVDMKYKRAFPALEYVTQTIIVPSPISLSFELIYCGQIIPVQLHQSGPSRSGIFFHLKNYVVPLRSPIHVLLANCSTCKICFTVTRRVNFSFICLEFNLFLPVYCGNLSISDCLLFHIIFFIQIVSRNATLCLLIFRIE